MIKEHDREIKMERLLYLLYMHKCFLPISNLSLCNGESLLNSIH